MTYKIQFICFQELLCRFFLSFYWTYFKTRILTDDNNFFFTNNIWLVTFLCFVEVFNVRVLTLHHEENEELRLVKNYGRRITMRGNFVLTALYLIKSGPTGLNPSWTIVSTLLLLLILLPCIHKYGRNIKQDFWSFT